MDAFKLILVSLVGWMNRQQQHVIEYLQEEVRILKEQQGDGERNHQGLGNKIIEPDFGSDGRGEVQCRQRLGGLLRYYYRDAA